MRRKSTKNVNQKRRKVLRASTREKERGRTRRSEQPSGSGCGASAGPPPPQREREREMHSAGRAAVQPALQCLLPILPCSIHKGCSSSKFVDPESGAERELWRGVRYSTCHSTPRVMQGAASRPRVHAAPHARPSPGCLPAWSVGLAQTKNDRSL
jgi:hypothetical protein